MKTPLLLSPSPVRALSTPALCITFGMFFKASVRKRGYNVQAQPQVSLIYKEPPVLKVSPLRAQETECRHEVGQISPGVCHWPGLREPAQLSFLGCREHPTIPHQGWCIVWPKTPHLWGHSQGGVRAPTASSAPPEMLPTIRASGMLQMVSLLAFSRVVCFFALLCCW